MVQFYFMALPCESFPLTFPDVSEREGQIVPCPHSPADQATAPGPCSLPAPVRKHMDTLLIHHHKCNFVPGFPSVLFHVFGATEPLRVECLHLTCFIHSDCFCFHSFLHSFIHPAHIDHGLPAYQDTLLGAGDPSPRKLTGLLEFGEMNNNQINSK